MEAIFSIHNHAMPQGQRLHLTWDYYYIQQHHSTKKGVNYQMMCRQNVFGVTELFPAVDTFMGNEVCQASKKVPAHLAFINQVTLISQ